MTLHESIVEDAAPTRKEMGNKNSLQKTAVAVNDTLIL